MITTDKILFEYAKVIVDILSGEPSDTDKKNVIETLQKLTLDYRKDQTGYEECENGMLAWFSEALTYTKDERCFDIVLNRVERAIDCYNYYNKGVEI